MKTFALPALPMVLLANAPWFIFPFIIIARLWKEHPFTRDTTASAPESWGA